MRAVPLALVAVLLGGAAARADCVADFTAIMQHGREAGPFRVDGEASVGALHMETVTEVIVPDTAHLLVSTSRGDQEVIIVGDRAWGKVKGLWLALDEGTMRRMHSDYVAAGILYSDGARNIECLGGKVVDGVSYVAFKYDAAIANFTVPMTVYVDPASRLPVRTEGSVESGGDTARFSATYKLDPALKIEPPPQP
ncbi:hypothetical protein LMIY3S_01291 [Labrys miyagiensis]